MSQEFSDFIDTSNLLNLPIQKALGPWEKLKQRYRIFHFAENFVLGDLALKVTSNTGINNHFKPGLAI